MLSRKFLTISFIFSLLTIHYSPFTFSQTPNQIINTVNQKFKVVNDYKANVRIECKIPSVKIEAINAKVIYKRPDKFKVKAAGILVLPRQNINFLFSTLSDTSNYTAVKTGEEMIGNVKTEIVSVIPNKDTSDLILGKLWIDPAEGLILKSQLTTKSQGTILIEYTFGSMARYDLPDKMQFTVETQKFKLPKGLTMDIHSSSKETKEITGDGKGRITLTFSNYEVNTGVREDELK